MSSNLSNVEILNILLEGKNLDHITSRSLMQDGLMMKYLMFKQVLLSALRAKGCTGDELCSMAQDF